MIELVGMMFEYMLNDDEIPNVAKAELSRLHTPYLKVAIIDKPFLPTTVIRHMNCSTALRMQRTLGI